MATSDAPLNVPNVTLAVARSSASNSPGQRTITGAGFGSGPSVVLFDRFAGTDREVLLATRQADIGAWKSKGGSAGYDSRLYADRGRTWFAHRDPAALGINESAGVWMFFETAQFYSEFRFSQRRWVPTDRHFPGADAPGKYDDSSDGFNSSWKPTWAAGSTGSDLDGRETNDAQADLVFDSHVGTAQIEVSGNSVKPMSSAGGQFSTGFSFTAPCMTTWYQSGAESSVGAYDQTVDLVLVQDVDSIREVRNDVDTFRVNVDTWSTMNKGYKGWRFGGLVTNGAPYDNAMPLLADFYLAVGPNSRACILTGDAATLATCTEAYIIPPDSWTDGEIAYTPASHENLTYTHLILADGTLIENAEGV